MVTRIAAGKTVAGESVPRDNTYEIYGTIIGDLNTAAAANILVDGGKITGCIITAGGSDTITLQNNANVVGDIRLHGGQDTLMLCNSQIGGQITSNGGLAHLDVINSSIGSNTYFSGASNTVTIQLINSRINGKISIEGGSGKRHISLDQGSYIGGASFGGNYPLNSLHVTKSTIAGNITFNSGLEAQFDGANFTNNPTIKCEDPQNVKFEFLTAPSGNFVLDWPHDVAYTDAMVEQVVTDALEPGEDFIYFGGKFTFAKGGQAVSIGQIADVDALLCLGELFCFAAGTKILTPEGYLEISELSHRNLVRTMNGTLLPIKWIGSRKMTTMDLELKPQLRPIRISAGSLGDKIPSRDLLVAPQQRMLIRSKIAKRLFGEVEVLVPAAKLLPIEGIALEEDITEVVYYHILLGSHEIIMANGAPSETFFLGDNALKALSPIAREDIMSNFPQVFENRTQSKARTFVQKNANLDELIKRHARNQKSLVAQSPALRDVMRVYEAD